MARQTKKAETFETAQKHVHLKAEGETFETAQKNVHLKAETFETAKAYLAYVASLAKTNTALEQAIAFEASQLTGASPPVSRNTFPKSSAMFGAPLPNKEQQQFAQLVAENPGIAKMKLAKKLNSERAKSIVTIHNRLVRKGRVKIEPAPPVSRETP